MELKDRIVEEASKLFFQRGIKSITMDDIASHMGISKRTLYELFSDKEDLLEECIDKSIRHDDCEMQGVIEKSENVIDAMMRIYAKLLTDIHHINKSAIFDLKKYHPKLYQKIEEKQKEGIEQFIPYFEEGVEQGLMENDINFEVLLWLLKAQFKILMEGDFLPTDKYPVEEYVRAIILNFARGIATPKGNQIIAELVAKLNEERKNK